jgi:protein subunit release factor A
MKQILLKLTRDGLKLSNNSTLKAVTFLRPYHKNANIDDDEEKIPRLVESTKAKLTSSFEASSKYITHLFAEKKRLIDLVSREDDDETTKNKGDLVEKLNHITSVTDLYNLILKNSTDLDELAEELKSNDDAEMRQLLTADIDTLTARLLRQKLALINSLVESDEANTENAVLELSAGVGGLESRIFCSELFQMYRVYSQKKGWSFEPVKIFTDQTEMGEMMRQAYVEVSGQNVFEHLKFESGVHRVQRVPKVISF